MIAISALAAWLRFTSIASEPFWIDEGYSWWDAQQSLHDLWALVPQCDPHPPLYFLLLKGWMNLFGDGAAAMRALSAIIGVATTSVVFFAGREIGRRVAWISGLLFAAAPFQIYFAHEARPYALLCFGASLMLLGAIRVTRSITNRQTSHPETVQPSMRAWLPLIVGGAMVLWTNNTSVLLLASLTIAFVLIFCFDRDSRSAVRATLLCGLVILILWAPYIPELINQARGVSADFWIQRPNLWGMTEEFRYMFGLNSGPAGWWMIFIMLCGVGLLWRLNWQMALMLLALAVFPALMNIAISLTVKPIFISRALIGIVPAFTLAFAVAIALVQSQVLRVILVLLLAFMHINAVHGLLNTHNLKEPWDELATKMLQENGPVTKNTANDTIILMISNELVLPLTHMLSHGPFVSRNAMMIPRQGLPANYPAPGLDLRYPSGKCDPAVMGMDYKTINAMVAGRKQVFFITRRNNTYDPNNSIRSYLLEHGWRETSMAIFQPGDLELFRFVPSAEASANAATNSSAQ